jgi:tetratricopeptide (TPR) repeat protein
LGLALYDRDRRVKVEQAVAVKAKAEVEEAQEAVDEALTDKDILKAILNSVFPGGGAIAEKVAGRELPRPALPTESLTDFKLRIGTPSDLAARSVRTFYTTIADVNWPAEGTVSEADIELIDQARVKWGEGDADAAQQLVSQYLARRPAQSADAEALQMRAALFAVIGRFDLMLADANALLDAGTPSGHVWRGLARLMLNEARTSLRDFDRAKIADPEQKAPWIEVFRGLALLQSENPAEAKAIFQEVLKDPPTTMAAHLGLGVTARLGHALALHTEEKYEEALLELERVLKSDPKNLQALTLRGECRAWVGDLDGALRDFKEAINVAGYLPELLARYVAVMNLRDSARDPAQPPVAADIQPRHGAEPDDKSAPPVFKWLRSRMPDNESGTMQPESSLLPFRRIGLPFP